MGRLPSKAGGGDRGLRRTVVGVKSDCWTKGQRRMTDALLTIIIPSVLVIALVMDLAVLLAWLRRQGSRLG